MMVKKFNWKFGIINDSEKFFCRFCFAAHTRETIELDELRQKSVFCPLHHKQTKRKTFKKHLLPAVSISTKIYWPRQWQHL